MPSLRGVEFFPREEEREGAAQGTFLLLFLFITGVISRFPPHLNSVSTVMMTVSSFSNPDAHSKIGRLDFVKITT